MVNEQEIKTTNATVDENSTVDIQKEPKKRGRKPSPNKKVYFGEEEEQAFIEYVKCEDKHQKDRIFAKKLYYPFTKMIESIIRRYNLFTPDEPFDDTFFDTMSFMLTKISNFDPNKNYKAYSYCGTICKNYLILKRTQYIKKMQKQLSYEIMFPNVESDNRVDNEEVKKTNDFNVKLINNTIVKLREILSNAETKHLTINEINVGNALIDMLLNWEEIFEYLGSKKFNKSCVLQFIRDYTNLPTKDIRESMSKFKEVYYLLKESLLVE